MLFGYIVTIQSYLRGDSNAMIPMVTVIVSIEKSLYDLLR